MSGRVSCQTFPGDFPCDPSQDCHILERMFDSLKRSVVEESSVASELYDLPEDERRRRVEAADRRIGTLASHINAATCELLDELADLVGAGGWSDHGAKTPEEWIGWRCGITRSDAHTFVRMALKLPELPRIREAFRAGKLSYWQVRALLPIATPEIEERLLEMARYTTAAQLARLTRAYKGMLDRAELERTNERHRTRSLNYFFDDDGFLNIRGKLSPEDGALFIRALEAAVDELKDDLPEDDQPVAWDAIRADALVEMTRRALAGPGSSAAGAAARPASVPEVIVHVDLRSLIEGSGDRCELEDGPVLASETVRRLACDATIQTMLKDGDKPLDFGRRQRTAPPRLRRALEERDRTCRFPGCDRKAFLQAHHHVPWPHLGPTNPANTMLLCFFHHRLVHEGGFKVVGLPDGELDFYTPDGKLLPRAPHLPGGDARQLILEHRDHKKMIGHRNCTTQWEGKQPNYADCVDALLASGGMLALSKARGDPIADP